MGVGVIFVGQSLARALELLLPAITTLFAAYFGTSYAFELNAKQLEQESTDQKVLQGNKALFTLVRIFNQLLVFQRDFIEPHRRDPAAFINMPPTLTLDREEIVLDFDGLSFLLEFEDPNLLGELAVGVSKYTAGIDAINSRSNMHRDVLQPKLHAAGVREGMDIRIADIRRVLGELDFVVIEMATNQVIEHVDETINYLRDTAAKLTAALRNKYPRRKILKLAMPDDPDEGQAIPEV